MTKVGMERTVRGASGLTPEQLRDIPRTHSVVNTLGAPYVWPNGYVTADVRGDDAPPIQGRAAAEPTTSPNPQQPCLTGR